MFFGFVDEGQDGTLLFLVRNAAGTPITPDAAPTWRIYGPNGLVASGSGTAAVFESGSITGATNASPIVITSAAHGVTTGQGLTVSGVGGNTAANGTFIATVLSSGTFSLGGSTGNAAYTSGGSWKTTGLYKVALAGAVLNSLEAGRTYAIVITWTESGVERAVSGTFAVR